MYSRRWISITSYFWNSALMKPDYIFTSLKETGSFFFRFCNKTAKVMQTYHLHIFKVFQKFLCLFYFNNHIFLEALFPNLRKGSSNIFDVSLYHCCFQFYQWNQVYTRSLSQSIQNSAICACNINPGNLELLPATISCLKLGLRRMLHAAYSQKGQNPMYLEELFNQLLITIYNTSWPHLKSRLTVIIEQIIRGLSDAGTIIFSLASFSQAYLSSQSSKYVVGIINLCFNIFYIQSYCLELSCS